jgi:hypothetical protein
LLTSDVFVEIKIDSFHKKVKFMQDFNEIHQCFHEF